MVHKTITIKHIFTKDQIADIFQKPLRGYQFYKLAILLISWKKEQKVFRMLHDLFMKNTLDPSRDSEIFMTELFLYANKSQI